MDNGYQVIARRWRPKQFDELVGQDHIVRTLSNAIETNRIAHAYLFVGPRGTGKTSSARLFAKALNAEGGPSIAPDNDSEIAHSIMDGSCMDVIEIDGASNNSVDQIRDLREDCRFAPTQCSFKIYIIDEVHMLSTAAFNALLKTLEEPPPHVKFIFATTEANKILPTIVSRCQRFEFRPISDEVIVEKLSQIAKAESIEVAPEALRSIARLANGGMRDSQSILDQMISFCGSSITEEDVLDVYGLASQSRIEALAKAMAALDFPTIVQSVDTFADEGRDLFRILQDLQALIRQALLQAIENGGRTDTLGTELATESIMRMLDALHRSESAVQRGLSEKDNFEVALLKASEESRSRAIDSLIKQLAANSGEKKKLIELPPAPADPGPLRLPDPEKPIPSGVEQPPIPDPTPVAPPEALQVEEAPPEKTIQTETVEAAPAPASAPEADPGLSLEDAKRLIGPEALQVLKERFNGKLTIARQPDARDQLF